MITNRRNWTVSCIDVVRFARYVRLRNGWPFWGEEGRWWGNKTYLSCNASRGWMQGGGFLFSNGSWPETAGSHGQVMAYQRRYQAKVTNEGRRCAAAYSPSVLRVRGTTSTSAAERQFIEPPRSSLCPLRWCVIKYKYSIILPIHVSMCTACITVCARYMRSVIG